MSAVPAAIDGLLAQMRLSPVLGTPDVLICDGPWLQRPQEPDVVVIGWLPAEGPTVEWHARPVSLREGDEREDFTIQGLISAWRGDTDLKAARDRADVLLEAVRTAIQEDRSLGGAVSHSQLITLSLAHWQLEDGVEVPIQFGVRAVVL
jgi:hypothetical protein